MNPQYYTVWITKYALTKGIQKEEALLEYEFSNNKVLKNIITIPGRVYDRYVSKPYWHLTEEDAIEHAENMRSSKIESLRRQISKLQNKKIKIN